MIFAVFCKEESLVKLYAVLRVVVNKPFEGHNSMEFQESMNYMK